MKKMGKFEKECNSFYKKNLKKQKTSNSPENQINKSFDPKHFFISSSILKINKEMEFDWEKNTFFRAKLRDFYNPQAIKRR